MISNSRASVLSSDARIPDDLEYGVRSHDDLEGTRVTPKPTLVMAEDYADYLRRISDTRGTYKIRVELVHRLPGGEWTPLSSEDAQQIKDEAWAGLDRAMEPVIAVALGQYAQQLHANSRATHQAGGA